MDTLQAITFVHDGKELQAVQNVEPPRKGETVELGAFFDDGEKIDIATKGGDQRKFPYRHFEYRTFFVGEVVSVTRHYSRTSDRYESTITVELRQIETNPTE